MCWSNYISVIRYPFVSCAPTRLKSRLVAVHLCGWTFCQKIVLVCVFFCQIIVHFYGKKVTEKRFLYSFCGNINLNPIQYTKISTIPQQYASILEWKTSVVELKVGETQTMSNFIYLFFIFCLCGLTLRKTFFSRTKSLTTASAAINAMFLFV